MASPSLRSFLATACIAACLLDHAAFGQSGSAAGANSTAPAEAFAIAIEAPDDIRDTLERHLELQRYRVLPDLSDAEIQSLMTSAQQNASDLLATMGYFSPEIHISLQRPPPPATGKVVHIDVQAGPPTRVDKVNLQLLGAIAQDPRAEEQRKSIQDLWSLATEDRFSQSAWDTAKEQALKQLLAKRYPTAMVVSSHAEVHPEESSVDLDLQLDSGPAYKLGSMEVTGNQRYSAELAKRLAQLPIGGDYELATLVDAQQRLTDSGYYDSAYLNLDLNGDPQQAVVHAQLKEASMQKAVFGIGASTDTGARISAEHTYNQVPGIDWRAVNKLTLARDSKSFASDWTSQPGESRWRWATSALVQDDKVDQIEIFTERLRLGRFTTDVVLDQSYYLQYERAEAVYREIGESSNNEALSANYAFAWRHFDSKVFPTRGWGFGGELAAGTVLGSRPEPFTRALLHAALFQPLDQSLDNLFARQHAGRIMYRAQAGGVVVDDASRMPFSQLFLTGGDTTVRGYKYQEIGVSHDGVLSADAGRYMATASAEWQRPIVRNGQMTDWETAVFVDTGSVANRVEEFSFKTGVGVGARWRSPIGPLQIDLAYGLATQALRLHLNVGFVF
jgi:translocation and assembly module TamA